MKIVHVTVFFIGVILFSSCRLFDALDESGYSRQGKLTFSPNTTDLSGYPQRVGTVITFKGQYFAPANWGGGKVKTKTAIGKIQLVIHTVAPE